VFDGKPPQMKSGEVGRKRKDDFWFVLHSCSRDLIEESRLRRN